MRKTEDLHPLLQEKIEELKAICKNNGLLIGIGECVRTVKEQDELYAKGRTVPGKVVTNARGSTFSSMHQWGVAFDFYRNDGRGAFDESGDFFAKVGKLGKSIGLEWGGDWKSPVDKPHFQLPCWGSSASILKKKYKTPEEFMKSWEVAMTEDERQILKQLEEAVEKLKNNSEKVYHYTCELPDWARPTVQKLLDKGLYQGSAEDDLNLPESLMRVLVINDRARVYD